MYYICLFIIYIYIYIYIYYIYELYICVYIYIIYKYVYIYIYVYICIYIYLYMAHHFILLRLNPVDLRIDREGWWFEHCCVIDAGLLICRGI